MKMTLPPSSKRVRTHEAPPGVRRRRLRAKSGPQRRGGCGSWPARRVGTRRRCNGARMPPRATIAMHTPFIYCGAPALAARAAAMVAEVGGVYIWYFVFDIS
jgi:hypothetical protein